MAKKILIVDDEKNIALVLKELFQAKGYEVWVAFTGKEALKHIGNEDLDLVSLDIQIPDMNGVEILKKVRKKYPSIKTVVLSGYLDEYKEEIEKIGCDAFLTKPFSIKTLMNVVDSTLAQKKDKKKDLSKLIDDPGVLAKARLLFVEPNAIMYSSKLGYFKDSKTCKGEYEFEAAFTEEEAADKIEKFRPDIVLSNINIFRLYNLAGRFTSSKHPPKDVILYGLSDLKDSASSKDVSFIGGLFDPITAIVKPAEMDKLGKIVRLTAISHSLFTRAK